ncbi:glycosyltransferase involved in cell wall biosynthesis [Marinobacter sp. MBR-99]|jgi:glycosyltransferase involved in cell wall biosynthesis|uniref:glycosyltransferase n=1 Tax=Marinobacter sp. MBR-99 TaxID=3156461 RepID=UPI00339B78B2
MNEKSAIWVTWEYQTRNGSLSRLLKVPLYEIVSEKTGLRRYAESLLRTFRLIRSEKPQVVFCQNPSIVLSLFCVLFKNFLSYAVVVDEHNAGLFPLDGQKKLLNWIARYIVRKADAVIVTNDSLAEICSDWSGRPIVMEDPLPDFKEEYAITQKVKKNMVVCAGRPFELLFICTWAPDEPYMNVLQAAKSFSKDALRITITGNHRNKIDPLAVPDNVHLTGFLSKSDYVNHLAKADGVLVLTTRQDCLNCGAYEAVSLLKPGILSDTSALRGYFASGFVFTDNSAENLVECIKLLMEQARSLRAGVRDLKKACENNDIANYSKIREFLEKLV